MTVATIYMPSTPAFTNASFYLVQNTQTFKSPLTNTTQRQLLGGAAWAATYSLPAMNNNQASAWKAFFMLLEGSANTFYGFDPDHKKPRGVVGGTPLVNGASQTGSSLIIDGCPNSVLFLRTGDYFSVNSELKMITSDVFSDGSGNATLNFKPALRNSPSDDQTIVVWPTIPTCLMIMADNQQGKFVRNSNGIYQPLTFTCAETFTA